MAEKLSFKRHRFPPDVIRYAVWLYFRFTLSFRDEELLAERGIEVSYETIRCWTIKFGPHIAGNLKARRPAPSPRWHAENRETEPMLIGAETAPRKALRSLSETALDWWLSDGLARAGRPVPPHCAADCQAGDKCWGSLAVLSV
jgi:transposase-like protein